MYLLPELRSRFNVLSYGLSDRKGLGHIKTSHIVSNFFSEQVGEENRGR